MNEKKELKKIFSLMDEEYLNIVSEILNNSEFKKRLEYHHHENRSVYVHSLMVSYKAYKIAKLLRLDYKKAAIGGLLHDFYYEDWQKTSKQKVKITEMHGFAHPRHAYENSCQLFPNLIDDKIEDIITRHMFPLTIKPPRYFESWIVTSVDKYVSLEIFKTPNKLYKYIGIKPKEKKEY